MKFKVYVKVLNEIVGAATEKLLGEVTANSHHEAKQLADAKFGDQGMVRIDNGIASVEY